MEMMTDGKFRHVPVVEDGRARRASSRSATSSSTASPRSRPRRRRCATTSRPPERCASLSRSRRGFRVSRIISTMSGRARSAPGGRVRCNSSARWNSNRPILASFGEIITSGGSPARRERAMRSWVMLKASTITVAIPGASGLRGAVGRGAGRRCPSAAARPWPPRSRPRRSVVRIVGLDHRSARPHLAVQVDADDDVGAERARRGDRDRVDERAVHQPAPAEQDRVEHARQRVGGPHRLDERPAREPDLVAGDELGGDRAEADRQGFRPCRSVRSCSSRRCSRPPAIRPEPRDVEVEQPHDPALGQRMREGLELVELAGGVAAADHRADRAAGDHVRHDAGSREHPHHADMRPAAGRAAAERQARS